MVRNVTPEGAVPPVDTGGGGSKPTLPFSAWLESIEASWRDGTDMEVDCGACRGCCTSSYFIAIAPEEKETLARIPRRLLFPAPGRPKGHVLLGYDEKGHCPMFRGDACSIYAHRPRTCRAYDCRIFAATGISDPGKPAIAGQAVRWSFGLPSERDRILLQACREAARFLETHADRFPAGFLPADPAGRAALALKVHQVFLGGRSGIGETVEAIMRMARRKPR